MESSQSAERHLFAPMRRATSPTRSRAAQKTDGTIAQLWRYAVKGLDRDEFESVHLVTGSGLANDRRWAMHYRDPDRSTSLALLETSFDPASPKWLHKSNFLCAYSAPETLGKYETSYSDESDVLTVRRRGAGQQLLRAKLTDATERARAEAFFSGLHGKQM